QTEVNAMAEAINNAADAMTYKCADYSNVEAAIENANAKIDTGLYTDESVAAVQNAINAVENGLDITHQTEVNAMAEAINNAADAMIYKPADYSELETAVEEAQDKIATGYYTDDSVSNLESKISVIVSNLDITHQNEIDGWKNDIVKATKELELKLADYTELQKILNLLDNSVSEIYTISYTNFNEVMLLMSEYRSSSVRMDVTIDKQSDVDLMVSTLQNYIDSLIPYVAPAERFEFINTAAYTEIDGVNYAYGFKTLMTKSQFADFVDYEGVYYEIESMGSRYVGTGSVIRVYSETTDELINEFVVVIYGDIDGNAKIDFDDASAINLALSGEMDALEGAAKLAANVYGARATINAQDAEVILDAVTGLVVINQETGKVVA
ncbi:MAG: hypothetical protein MJ168_11670, partial [Clostridia bacterium]|nr:hypothetical protein [Clostridia bacterium]